MLKVIRCNQGVLEHLPSIYELIHEIYGEKNILLYAVVDDKDYLSFLVVDGITCLYINNNGYKVFQIDKDCNLLRYSTKDYDVYLNGDMCFVGKDKKEYRLSFLPLDEPDEEYTGEVLFNQYNPENDTFCQLAYHQMYYEYDGKAPIYSYHTKEPYGVYIEQHNSEDHDRSFGLIHPAIQNYNMYTFERGTIGYNNVLIRDHGLVNFLLNNSYQLERADKVKKYVKSAFMFNGQFHEAWPFCRFHDTSEVDSIIQQYGFLKEVPQELLNIYNDQDGMLKDIKDILEQLKEKEVRDECSIRLQLVPDNK